MTLSALQEPLIDQQHIVLDDVSWDFYEHLLDEVGDRPIRVTYYKGRLEIMAPLDIHEDWTSRIGQMIEIMCLERDIKVVPRGSTTFKRKARKAGLEPDRCYYIQHADLVRFKTSRDFKVVPPPDLAVEVDITSRSIDREPIYAALGVPEIWRFDGKRLTALKLASNGEYVPRERSNVFPFLPMDRFNDFLKRFRNEEHNAVVRAFRDWVVGLK